MLSSFWIVDAQSVETIMSSNLFAITWISLHVFPPASCGFTSTLSSGIKEVSSPLK